MKAGGSDQNRSGSPFLLGLLAAMLGIVGLFIWLANLQTRHADGGPALDQFAAVITEATHAPTPEPQRATTPQSDTGSGPGAAGTAKAVQEATPAPPLSTRTAGPVTTVPPPPTCGYCQRNLVGKTPGEIGQFALQYVQENGYVRSGTPQVLLSRPITRREFTALGLGCLPSFSTIEQPSFALVILKGDFEVRAFPIRGGGILEPGEQVYVGFVFDLWAGKPTSLQITRSGDWFRTVLGDPSLPTPEVPLPSVCPTEVPGSERTLHYGESAPGFTTPPALPPEMRPATPTPGR